MHGYASVMVPTRGTPFLGVMQPGSALFTCMIRFRVSSCLCVMHHLHALYQTTQFSPKYDDGSIVEVRAFRLNGRGRSTLPCLLQDLLILFLRSALVSCKPLRPDQML